MGLQINEDAHQGRTADSLRSSRGAEAPPLHAVAELRPEFPRILHPRVCAHSWIQRPWSAALLSPQKQNVSVCTPSHAAPGSPQSAAWRRPRLTFPRRVRVAGPRGACRPRQAAVAQELGAVSRSSSGTFFDGEVVERRQGPAGPQALLPSSEEPSLLGRMSGAYGSWWIHRAPGSSLLSRQTPADGGSGTDCQLSWGSPGPQGLQEGRRRGHGLSLRSPRPRIPGRALRPSTAAPRAGSHPLCFQLGQHQAGVGLQQLLNHITWK